MVVRAPDAFFVDRAESKPDPILGKSPEPHVVSCFPGCFGSLPPKGSGLDSARPFAAPRYCLRSAVSARHPERPPPGGSSDQLSMNNNDAVSTHDTDNKNNTGNNHKAMSNR